MRPVVLKNKILLRHLFQALCKANPLTMTKANHTEWDSLFYTTVFTKSCWLAM